MKALKKISIILLCGLLLCTAAAGFYYVAATAGAKLDEAKLECTDACIEVYDAKDNKISDLSFKSANKSVRFSELPAHVPHAFVAAEDKNFYSHRGLDYKGMARALLKNIKARSFKQGASTISQQLIKNTQLSSEKTLARKLKEILERPNHGNVFKYHLFRARLLRNRGRIRFLLCEGRGKPVGSGSRHARGNHKVPQQLLTFPRARKVHECPQRRAEPNVRPGLYFGKRMQAGESRAAARKAG